MGEHAPTSTPATCDAATRPRTARPIAEAPDRELVRLRGTLRTVTLRPRGGVPALEAELYDGTGVLIVVWLGRRRIAGIDPGARCRSRAGSALHDGQRIMYNPRYELMP